MGGLLSSGTRQKSSQRRGWQEAPPEMIFSKHPGPSKAGLYCTINPWFLIPRKTTTASGKAAQMEDLFGIHTSLL